MSVERRKISGRRGVLRRLAFAAAAVLVMVPAVSYVSLAPDERPLDDEERARLGGTYSRLSRGVTHYALEGPATGRTVVIVHGATIPSFGFDRQADALRGAGLRVLRYDQFGRGRSDKPDATYDTRMYVEQLRELLDALRITGTVDLVGHSLGGAIAVEFAAAFPGRVGRIALVAPVVDGVRDGAPFAIARVPVVGALTTRVITLGVLRSRAAKSFEVTGARADEYVARYVEQMEHAGFERSLLSLFRSGMIGDHRAAYRAVGAMGKESMIVWGTLDDDIPREHVLFAAAALRGARLRELDGVGHNPNLEAPKILNSLLIEFLAR